MYNHILYGIILFSVINGATIPNSVSTSSPSNPFLFKPTAVQAPQKQSIIMENVRNMYYLAPITIGGHPYKVVLDTG